MSGLSTLSLHIMMPGRPARLSGSSMTYDIAAAQAGTDMNASDRLATAMYDLFACLAVLARAIIARYSVSVHSISVHADAAHSDAASLVSAPISGLIPALKMVWRFKNPPVNCAVQSTVQRVVNWHASVLS